MPRTLRFAAGLFLALFAGLVIDAPREHSKSEPAKQEAHAKAEKAYLAECLQAAESLKCKFQSPTPAQYKRRLDAAFAAYDRIPEAPAGADPHGVRASLRKELRLRLCQGQVLLVRGDVAGCRRLSLEIERRVKRLGRE